MALIATYKHTNPRILVVTFAYPPIIGGLPQQAHLLNQTLQKSGVQVTVVTIRVNGYPNFEKLDGVPIHRLWTLQGEPKGYRSRIYPWLIPLAAFLVVHRHEYDIIHIHQAGHPAAVCVLLGKLLHKPTLIRVTGSGQTGNIAFLKKWWIIGSIVRPLIRYTDCFISLSEDITAELLSEGIPREKIVYIHNGVDTAKYSPVSHHAEMQSIRIVLGVGRLTEEKGFDILVRAWPKVVGKMPNTRLIIVGNGTELPMLKSLVQQLNIHETISFEGNRENVTEYLADADIFVLPSRNEGMSNALLEAMAMGRACIGSNIPPNQEVLISEVDGLLFKSNDAEDLAEKILQLMQKPHLARKLGEKAREKIVTKFSIDTVAKKYLDLYADLYRNIH